MQLLTKDRVSIALDSPTLAAEAVVDAFASRRDAHMDDPRVRADALRHFEAAERIQPGFYLRNRMMIAKCYANLKDRNAAREWLQRAVEMPVATVDDEVALAAAKTALAAL